MKLSIPTPLEKQLPYLMRTATEKVQEAITQHLNPLRIDVREFEVMALVGNDDLNQITVAGAVGVNRNVMVRLVDMLEEKGLIKREVNIDNRREHILRLTQSGAKTLQQGEKIIRAAQERIVDVLDTRSKRMICEIMKLLIESEEF